MSKVTKNFSFHFPLTKKVVRDLRIQTLHLGDLAVTGKAYKHTNISELEEGRYSVDLESIEWKGVNLLDLFEAGQLEEFLSDIEDAALAHASYLFTSNVAA